MKNLTKELESHAKDIKARHLKALFESDPQRGQRMTAEAAGLFLDYSKNLVTDETIALLIRLANECGLRERMDAMFLGDKINITENRAVLHTALRAPKDATILVDGKNVVPEVHAVLGKMAAFSEQVGCIILGRGEKDQKIHEWLVTDGSVPGFIGFAVGRTDFWDSLVQYRAGKITREAAVVEIARRFTTYVKTFEGGRPSSVNP